MEQKAKRAMTGKLYEMKRVPSRTAAASVGMDRVGILLSVHRYGVPMIDLAEDEFRSDPGNA